MLLTPLFSAAINYRGKVQVPDEMMAMEVG
jgi:hypothetical protein